MHNGTRLRPGWSISNDSVDTNVVSEPLCRVPQPHVADWLYTQALEKLYLSAITAAELRLAVQALPNSRL